MPETKLGKHFLQHCSSLGRWTLSGQGRTCSTGSGTLYSLSIRDSKQTRRGITQVASSRSIALTSKLCVNHDLKNIFNRQWLATLAKPQWSGCMPSKQDKLRPSFLLRKIPNNTAVHKRGRDIGVSAYVQEVKAQPRHSSQSSWCTH